VLKQKLFNHDFLSRVMRGDESGNGSNGNGKPMVLYMGTFPPRECGIATFTRDVTDAINKNLSPQVNYGIVAMNANGSSIYNYLDKVLFEINDRDVDEYIETAKAINKMDDVVLVNIQHEYGIFGEDYGKYLIDFLHVLEKPVVITLHSLLPDPNRPLKRIVRLMEENSDAFVVMAQEGVEILRKKYGVTGNIHFIPHGIPFVPYEDPIHQKKRLGFEDRTVISGFGMMNRGKGYEYVIDALPDVVDKFPELLYLIIGETHPIVRKHEGEEYRNFIEDKVKENGLQKHVKFYNKYVKLHEIVNYLRASDIYIGGGLDHNQITSGTLAYAMGAGRPVIATPFVHAKEIVSEERGRLAKFRDPESFKKPLMELLGDFNLRKKLGLNCYHFTRQMTWPNVALGYEAVFNKYVSLPEWKKNRVPCIKFSHLINLTDGFGVVQFAKNFEPQLQYGYTTDDISRALVAVCMSHGESNDLSKVNLIKTYLGFLKYVQRRGGKFYNYVDRFKKINMNRWTDDAHGRALWSLGSLISTDNVPKEMKESSREMFNRGVSFIKEVASPRAMAFTILGSHFYNGYEPDSDKVNLISRLSDRIVEMFEEHKDHDWKWFEDALTYDNSRIPEALLHSYLATGDEKYLGVALESLDFLSNVSLKDGMFMPVGQAGWFRKGGERAYFDQQPVDVGSMVQALVAAHNITRKKHYKEDAFKVFNWFLGKNALNQVMYDDYTGGCYDGIGKECININQGAESTVSYLLARLSLEKLGKMPGLGVVARK
jgi:glycosyltransferase involved in cell wall biosynthesis